LDFLEATLPFNCEHVVPQSWFDKKSRCAVTCITCSPANPIATVFAATLPYYDFPDFEEAIREACGKREENKFEPAFGKGPVARATLYFMLRYPGEINQTAKEYTAERLDILLSGIGCSLSVATKSIAMPPLRRSRAIATHSSTTLNLRHESISSPAWVAKHAGRKHLGR
jgi:hypothetical protein